MQLYRIAIRRIPASEKHGSWEFWQTEMRHPPNDIRQ